MDSDIIMRYSHGLISLIFAKKKNVASKDLSSEKQKSTPFNVSNASGFKILVTTLEVTP